MPTLTDRLRRAVLGAPRHPRDPRSFPGLSLVALLAWIGLGAGGLAVGARGPAAALRALLAARGPIPTGLAVGLASAAALAVFFFSYGYRRILEQFPSGGGYFVAGKILGPRAGVVSGAALLVGYALGITLSVSAGADALLGFFPALLPYKPAFACAGLAALALLSLRGVSVKARVTGMAPVFGLFLFTHAVALGARPGILDAPPAAHVAGPWSPSGFDAGSVLVLLALLSEGLLLFFAARAAFLDGPRVMAGMATDSWLPRRFSALSERLTMRNGVLLMAAAAGLVLAVTRGDVAKLGVMFAIDVFVTFSLSNLAMTVLWLRRRDEDATWWRRLPAHVIATLLCAAVLAVTAVARFTEGGWLSLLITVVVTALCFLVKRHYRLVGRAVRRLDRDLPGPEAGAEAMALYGEPLSSSADLGEPDPRRPVAVLFVGGYGGLGRHALLLLLRMFPGHFQGVVFVSVALIDSGTFQSRGEVGALEERTRETLAAYRRFGEALGLPSASAFVIGTEVAVEAERLGVDLLRRYPKALVVAGQIIFDEDTLWNRVLHNETAFMIQRRLQRAGVPMIVLPVQLDLEPFARRRRRSIRRTSADADAED